MYLCIFFVEMHLWDNGRPIGRELAWYIQMMVYYYTYWEPRYKCHQKHSKLLLYSHVQVRFMATKNTQIHNTYFFRFLTGIN
jgi:hypothetical protein